MDSGIDPFELAAIEGRRDPADVARLVAECRRLRRALAHPTVEISDAAVDDRASLRAAARAEAAELDLERAHRLLDEHGIPREARETGERDTAEYSLLGRLRLVLGDVAGGRGDGDGVG